jgi:hypothetical protein
MALQSFEMASEILGQNDKVSKNYPSWFEGKYGSLYLSKTRLIFIKEEGFMKKSYTKTLDLAYKAIKSVSMGKRDVIVINDVNDKVYTLKCDLSASIVKDSLMELMKTSS